MTKRQVDEKKNTRQTKDVVVVREIQANLFRIDYLKTLFHEDLIFVGFIIDSLFGLPICLKFEDESLQLFSTQIRTSILIFIRFN